jgi:hypothetical protein
MEDPKRDKPDATAEDAEDLTEDLELDTNDAEGVVGGAGLGVRSRPGITIPQ